MPMENFEEEGLAKNPNLEIAQWKFLLSTESRKNDNSVREKLMDAIKSDAMSTYYELICQDLHWPVDEKLLSEMKASNTEELAKVDAAIADAEENLGEIEVRDNMLKKVDYLSRSGDKEECLKVFQQLGQKTLTLGYRLDITFHQIRLGLFFQDKDLITRMLDKAESLMEEGGDWDRRNRLKVYQGVYAMSIRDFKTAASNFLQTVATFTSYELMPYSEFVVYTVLCSMISLERTELREKVILGAEILEQLHSLPELKQFLFSFYNCHYGDFFQCLANVEQQLKFDWLLAAHYHFYVREMRVLAYNQLLESYQSLTLDYMANAFGVTTEFMDKELSRFIAAGRLHCKIDKVNNIVETNRPDNKNYEYQSTIKHGDILLNRVQKLSRIINL